MFLIFLLPFLKYFLQIHILFLRNINIQFHNIHKEFEYLILYYLFFHIIKLILKKIIYVYFPSIKPSFLASCLNAMGLSWKSGIATEVLALPKRSMGSQLYYSKIYLETSELFAWTIVVILLSSLIELLIKKLLRGHIDENK